MDIFLDAFKILGWDKTTRAVIALLYLLPPTLRGKRNTNRLAIDVAVSRLVVFQKVGMIVLRMARKARKFIIKCCIYAVHVLKEQLHEFNSPFCKKAEFG